jgi:TM2 domain-containing membrane protein YozV
MATKSQVTPQGTPAKTASPTLCLLAGWAIPGAGHFLLKKPIRGLLLLFAILGMYTTGLALQGKIYSPSGDLLDLLGFAAQVGTGLLYVLAKAGNWGATSVQIATADYGKMFLIVAGLLNVVAAVDAHSLANGRKAS